MSIEINLNYLFFNKALLERALTRKAYADEQKHYGKSYKDQEAFCTLGDAVIKSVLVELLMSKGFQTKAEVTKEKQSLECKEKLAEIALNLEVDSYIKLGKGEQNNTRILAETLEALIAAIYLDGGYEAAKRVVSRLFERLI